MKLRNLMTTDVLTIGPQASLKEAARRMLTAGISGLPVTDDDGNLVGMVTEADFVSTEANRRKKSRKKSRKKKSGLFRFLDMGGDIPSQERLVADVMTPTVRTLGPDSDHPEAARLMESAAIKRIPIVEEGRLVGVVSRIDILKAFTRPDHEIVNEIQEHVMRRVLWVDPGKVTLTCADGNVRFSGRLDTKSDVILLVELTRRLDGVMSVSSNLTYEVDNTRTEMVGPRPWAADSNF